MDEYIITSPDFDFVELQTGLDVFAHMQLMDERLLLRLQLVVEELTMSGLVRSHDIKYPAKLSVEYSQTDKSCVVILIYKHPQMNVVDYVDELAMKLLSGDTQSIDYSYDENVNKITLTIKQ